MLAWIAALTKKLSEPLKKAFFFLLKPCTQLAIAHLSDIEVILLLLQIRLHANAARAFN